MNAYRTYKEYYTTYWKALQRGHLKFAKRMHELAHRAARVANLQAIYDGVIDAYLK